MLAEADWTPFKPLPEWAEAGENSRSAVLVSHAEVTSLRETIDILSDPLTVEDLRESEDDIARGKTVSADRCARRRTPPTR
ncbi:MAG: hypothetical protein WA880_00975 [Ornithinimicrobium sp.]